MNSKNNETSYLHRLLLNLTAKIDLRRKDKYMEKYMEKFKKSYKNNKFKISAPKWNEEFELPDGSYSISDIQYYFEYILKKHGEKKVHPSIRICINKIENNV